MPIASDTSSPARRTIHELLEAAAGDATRHERQSHTATFSRRCASRCGPHRRPERVGDPAGPFPTDTRPDIAVVDQAPARMCQSKAARRSPAASRCSAIRAAFSPTGRGRGFDRGGHAPMQLGAIRLELSLVGDRANQRVVEHILGLAGELDLIDELRRHQVVNDRLDAQHGQQVKAEPRADDRRRAQRAFRFWSKPIDARGDGRLQRGRHTHLSNLCRRYVCAAAPRAAHRARPVRARSPRRKTDYRRPSRRSSGPPDNRGVRPEQLQPMLQTLNRSAAQGQWFAHPPPESMRPDNRGDR